ncbi:MAG: hypothetical protein R6X12_08905 [bacterium]
MLAHDGLRSRARLAPRCAQREAAAVRSRGGSRLLQSYAAWKRRAVGALWSWQEDRLIDRFARAMIRGEYRSSWPAAAACRAELETLRRKCPDAPWAVVPRTRNAARNRIIQRARALGGRWPESHWSEPECRIAERHARRFLSGRCPSIKQAARDCKQDVDRELGSPSGPGMPVCNRPFFGIYDHILALVRAAGWSRPDGYWSAREKRLTARYARAVVKGRYPNASAAARACLAEYDRLRRRRPPPAWLARRRRYLGISRMIWRQLQELGWVGVQPDWSPAELRRADRLARAIIAGRYPGAVDAASIFRRETGRDGVRRSRRAVQGKICERARMLGRTPIHRQWSEVELAVLDRLARDFDAGRFESLQGAARVCLSELERLRSRRRQLPQRSLSSVFGRLRKHVRTRGRRWRRFWTPAETRALGKWTRWYDRRRQAGELRALGAAVDGLLGDLARVGSQRSRPACIHQLTRRRRRGATRA